jgi:hypothetical protein
MTRRRRAGPPELVVICWRDIPAQVTVTGGEHRATAMLPARFQRAIDRAAKVAGMTDHQAYIGAWRRETRPVLGDPDEAVAATVDELDAAHDRAGLETLVRQGGLRAPTPTSDEPSDQPSPALRLADDPGGSP